MNWTKCSWVSWIGVLMAFACGVASVAWAGELLELSSAPGGDGSGWTGPVALLTGGGMGGTIAFRLLSTVDRLVKVIEEIWSDYRLGRVLWPRVVLEIEADDDVRELLRLLSSKEPNMRSPARASGT